MRGSLRCRHTHRASLMVPTTPDGLVFLVPRRRRGPRRGLRIVDAEVASGPSSATGAERRLEVSVAPGTPKEGEETVSVHRVSLPVRTVAPLTFRIALPSQLVARSVNVRGTTPEGTEGVLGSAYWTHPEDDEAHLEVSLFGQRVTALWLEIEVTRRRSR
jgi:hypothetical protein